MGHRSGFELLVLHGVRVLGGPTVTALATRFGLAAESVREALLDAQAFGWVQRHNFFEETWSLTDRGRLQEESLLAAELDELGLREVVREVHQEFLPLNARHGRACTAWQLRPERHDPLAANDHSDPVWDHEVLVSLEAIDLEFEPLVQRLAQPLFRFEGYSTRHRAAVKRARAGQPGWIDLPDRDSCQLVWIQFHEDLLATLGIPRGSDG